MIKLTPSQKEFCEFVALFLCLSMAIGSILLISSSLMVMAIL